MTENYLEIEDVLKLESLEACKGKKALKITKIQIFSFREEKWLSVWCCDKNISTFWQKRTFKVPALSVILQKKRRHSSDRSDNLRDDNFDELIPLNKAPKIDSTCAGKSKPINFEMKVGREV